MSVVARDFAGQGTAAGRAQQGSLSVELIVLGPLVIGVAFLLFQAFFAFSTVSSVEKAARDGARAAMRGDSVSAAVHASLPGWLTLESISADNGGAACPGVCVAVEARVPLGLPIWTSTDVTVRREAAMPRGDR